MSLEGLDCGTAFNCSRHSIPTIRNFDVEEKNKIGKGRRSLSDRHVFFQAQNTSWLLSGHAWLTRCVLVYRMARFSASCPQVLWNTSVEFLSDRTCSLSIFRVARECLWRIAPDINFEFECHWRLWCMLPYI